jgi:hypothetical protein
MGTLHQSIYCMQLVRVIIHWSRYRTIWDEFMGGCETLGFKSPMVAAEKQELQRLCRPIGVSAWWGTECMIAAHLARPEYGGVTIKADNAFAVPIIRPTGGSTGTNMGGGRRL